MEKRETDMSREANYHEFSQVPAYTAAQWSDGTVGERKLLNETDPYKWSGTKPPPAIGETVKIYCNKFGKGVVVSYFAEYGWLGLLVKVNKPPKWWIEQTKARGKDPKTTNVHVFGIDLEPRKGNQ